MTSSPKNGLRSLLSEWDVDAIGDCLATARGKDEARDLLTEELKTIWMHIFSSLYTVPEPSIRKVVSILIETVPNSLQIQLDENLHTPLQYALRHGVISEELLILMIKSAPEKVMTTRTHMDGQCLLQFAVREAARSQILSLIYNNLPQGTSMPDFDGNSALHYMVSPHAIYYMNHHEWTSCVQFMLHVNVEAAKAINLRGRLPLHLIASYESGAADRIIVQELTQTIYNAFPDAIQIRTLKNETPLSSACYYQNNKNIVQVMFLFKKYAGAVVIQDSAGRVPFQRFRMHRESCYKLIDAFSESREAQSMLGLQKDAHGNNIVHCLATLSDPHFRNDYRGFFLAAFASMMPNLTRSMNEYGQLPLHIRLGSTGRQGFMLDDVVPMVEEYPESAASRDRVSGLYPFMLVAVDDPACLPSTFYLLQMFLSFCSLENI
jgi:hypothetical protein